MDRAGVYGLIEKHFRTYASQNVSRLRHALGGTANAEETVQEAYSRACSYWKSFDDTQTIEQWLGTILRNCIRDRQRDTIMQGMVTEDAAPLYEQAKFDATDTVYYNEVRRRIDAESKRDAHILRLYMLEGYSGKELAYVTEISAEAIRKLVSRFKEQLVAIS